MTDIFEGRAIIVTGASSGLGRVIATELARRGAELWLVGRSADELAATARAIAEAGGPPAHCAPLDLRQRGPLEALVQEVGRAHPHLFAIVNNAGVMYPEPLLDGTIDRWQAMLDINVMAMLEGSKAAVEVMRGHGKPGHVVNIGSVAGRFEEPGVYGISKRAAQMIGWTLRTELEHDDIRVSTIIPGGFATNVGRNLTDHSKANAGRNLERLGIDRNSAEISKVVGDPIHVANAVRYILEQPIGINVQEIVVRPPISVKL